MQKIIVLCVVIFGLYTANSQAYYYIDNESKNVANEYAIIQRIQNEKFHLPKMVDKITRLDDVIITTSDVEYIFTIKKFKRNDFYGPQKRLWKNKRFLRNFIKQQKLSIINSIKGNKKYKYIKKLIKKFNYSVKYIYYYKNRQSSPLFIINITKYDLKEQDYGNNNY